MSDVSINYKGSEIASMNASGTKTLTTQGKYCEDDITINYTKPVPVEVEEKDVNFYDYDGTLLYSYTAQEFANLTELPANPTHTGLTAQGWNWTLSDAKTYVNTMGILDIGMYYVTSDNKTKIFISLTKETKSLYLGVAVNGSVDIDWGDGNTQITNGTSATDAVFTQHTYLSEGDYVISLYSSGTYRLVGLNTSSFMITCLTSDDERNILYANTITEVHLASNVDLGRFAFTGCNNLKAVSITTSTAIKDSACFNISSVKYLTMPNSFNGSTQFNNSRLKACSFARNITNTAGIFFANDTLKRVCLPDTITALNNYIFRDAKGLSYIKLPPSITTINGRAFYAAYGLKVADFSAFTSVPAMTIDNVFSNNQPNLKIVVPDNLYNDWISATNWANYASYIIKESDYNA